DRIPAVQHKVYFDIQPVLPSLQAKHDQRVKNDADFIFLQAQLTLADEARKHMQLSLNEAVRRKEMNDDKAKRLELENQRRSAKGEKALTKLEDGDDDDDDSAKTKDKEKDKMKEPDPLLNEAGHVLIDALPIYQKPSFADRYR
ncbi:MAG: tail-specific protease, partial [Verrucomicrobiaceae bacterium]|nr:tail-specific protease [Verrucomicrobiaceae bacterium]